jgi:hypothetical protein
MIVATKVFELVYDTGRPELAVAPRAKSALPKVFAGTTPKVMFWFAGFTVSVCVTFGAAV